MKKSVLLLVSVLLTQLSFGQAKSFDVAINAGIYTTPGFARAQIGANYALDFDYHFKQGWILSSGFNFGKFRYYETRLTNEPYVGYRAMKTNATTHDRQVNVKIKKELFKDRNYNIRVGAGVGLLTQTISYPDRSISGQSTAWKDFTFTDLAFPISVEPYVTIYSKLNIGLKAEMYIQPDVPLMGFNAGPQIRVKL